MRYVDEFRDPERVGRVAEALRRETTRPWTVMEVCGGQTHSIARFALDGLLPEGLELVHGPGCPVCVTPLEVIESAIRLAMRPGVVLCTFGDMLRVPGATGDLQWARARGGDVRVVLSPLDAVRIAAETPEREVVFLAVGFETTAPTAAMAVEWAKRRGLGNFSIVPAHVRVPPAMDGILSAPGNRVQAFLAAGHVCAVMGTAEYPDLVARHRAPVVVTGFEPLDILQGLRMAVRQLEEGRAEVEVQYDRAVRPEGNPAARAALERVFVPADRPWRGLGVVPLGGLALREEHAAMDATARWPQDLGSIPEPASCRAAEVLTGRIRPPECGEFGGGCTPAHPLGAPMVSSEGACAAYHRYRKAGRPER